MSHPFKHFIVITKHRHLVIRNAFHMGIFFHSLGHDLSKYGYTEFHQSAKYFTGKSSPVFLDRLNHDYYSVICQHHTKINRHHWEYWTDFFVGRILAVNMPYKYATEYVCDVLSASKNYEGKAFKNDDPLKYFLSKKGHYYLTDATSEYIEWCLIKFSESGFKELKRKQTKAKYQELVRKFKPTKLYENTLIDCPVPSLEKKD
ncbi:MAG: DUF5662 family protein [Bacilli bacterium]